MLTEFKVTNYKSFLEEASLTMTAAPKQTGLDYSLLKEKIKGKTIKGLSTGVIYGPNAAGKTNIIGAMDTFRSIVLRGNIRNCEENNSPNHASTALELIPNSESKEAVPVVFSVSFVENQLHIRYEIIIDLGLFLDSKYKRKIISEKLFVNDEKTFERASSSLTVNISKNLRGFHANASGIDKKNLSEIAINSLQPEELFLTNGFKLLFSPELTNLIVNWFTHKFMVIYRADSMQYVKRFSDPQKQTLYVENTTNDAARLFGINSNAIGYAFSEDENEAKLCSLLENPMDGKRTAIAAELFESYGTIRFINLFPLVIKAIRTGGTLVVDEFDASIHPMALMSIISVFHNDDINIHHAQLIFNTHNPVFLNSNILRRDEIKFVEREDEKHSSILYSLSDFGTSGEQGVRKHEDYLKYYFIGQYGAIKNIDFTPVFEDIFDKEEKA